jgi:hypothetical protein
MRMAQVVVPGRVTFGPARWRPLDLSYRTMIKPPRAGAVCQLLPCAAAVLAMPMPLVPPSSCVT